MCLELAACAIGIRSSTDDTNADPGDEVPTDGPEYEPGSGCAQLAIDIETLRNDFAEVVSEDTPACGNRGLENGFGINEGILVGPLEFKRHCDNLRVCAKAPTAECGNARLETRVQLRAYGEALEPDAVACGDEGVENGVGIAPPGTSITISEAFGDLCDRERLACEVAE